jgi:type IX secretion system PorP/SprF family membrane protein
MKTNLYIVVLILISGLAFGQEDPMYTQYNFNTQVFNPAYAGSWESMGFTVLGRYQWLTMPGAPKTVTLSMQVPTRWNKVSLGLNVVGDLVGKEKDLGVFADYSYKVMFGEETYLNLGLKAGFTNYHNNLIEYQQYAGGTPDPFAQADVQTRFMPNFGVGAFLFSENYFVGIAIPKIIQSEIFNNSNNFSVQSEIRHLFLHAGYVFKISEYLKIKPTFLIKATVGTPVLMDLTANFILKETILLGVMCRTSESFGFLAQWIIDKKLRFGYSIDYTTNALRSSRNGTHELMFSYELGMKRKWVSPRMM